MEGAESKRKKKNTPNLFFHVNTSNKFEKIKVNINVPFNTEGEFVYEGKTVKLSCGENEFEI